MIFGWSSVLNDVSSFKNLCLFLIFDLLSLFNCLDFSGFDVNCFEYNSVCAFAELLVKLVVLRYFACSFGNKKVLESFDLDDWRIIIKIHTKTQVECFNKEYEET